MDSWWIFPKRHGVFMWKLWENMDNISIDIDFFCGNYFRKYGHIHDISIYFYEQNMIFFSTWMFLWQIFCERRGIPDAFFSLFDVELTFWDDWLWMILYLLEKMKRIFLSVLQKSHVSMFLRWSNEAMVGWFSDRKFFQNLLEEIPMCFFL